MNKFVDYLNSLNNASGNNENAIAENQLNDITQFYKKVTVNREITKNIIKEVLGDTPVVYFLTGHAGDGKTSILLQIIEGLVEDMANFKFKEFDEISIKNSKRFHYVKDISELSKEEQLERFEYAVELAKENMASSVVISNTGQLLELFKKNGYGESAILEIIDSKKGNEISFQGARIRVINIALCDNTDFIREFISKIICDELWEVCKTCEHRERCIACKNVELVKHYEDKVSTFVENYYKWNSENNNRATIRQMVAHLSYAITGNENCNGIHKRPVIKERNFDNNFANLFFGYKRNRSTLKVDKAARNIKGIRDIQMAQLESKKLSIEYDVFVREDFNAFPNELRPYVEQLWREYRISENQDDLRLINTIKRIYMVFNLLDTDGSDNLYREIYSPVFPYYVNLKNNVGSSIQARRLKKTIFEGLFKLFTGFPSYNQDRLYLTLKQNGEKIQNVQVVQGYIYKDDLEVREKTRVNLATGKEYKELYLVLPNKEKVFLSYRMLDFLEQVNAGIVQTQIDPMLSQGIDNIKIALRKVMKPGDKGEITILVYTGKGMKIKKICLEEQHLYVTN